jgi:hypothetical protein
VPQARPHAPGVGSAAASVVASWVSATLTARASGPTSSKNRRDTIRLSQVRCSARSISGGSTPRTSAPGAIAGPGAAPPGGGPSSR